MIIPLQKENGKVCYAVRFFCCFTLLLLSVLISNAANRNWDGSASSDWNDAANWAENAVPGPTDAVKIGVTAFSGSQPNITANVSMASLIMGSATNVTLTVNAGIIVAITGKLTIQAGSTMDLGTGSITLGSTTAGAGLLRTNSTLATVLPTNKTWSFEVEYYGANQTVIDGTYNAGLTLSGSGTKTAADDIVFSSAVLTINTGTTLNMGAHVLSGSVTTAGAGLLQTANTSSTPISSGKTWSFEVAYTGAAQTVVAGTYNGNLTLSGTGTKTAGGAIADNGNLTIGTGITLDMGTRVLSGVTAQSGAGLVQTDNTSAAPLPSGITWAGNVEYTGTNQTVVAGTYNGNLTMSGSATKTAANNVICNGTLTINSGITLDMDVNALSGTFTPASTGLLKTANTSTTPIPSGKTWTVDIEYSGASQTVVTGTYSGDLTMSGSGTKTAAAAIAYNGLLTINTGVTLDMDVNALSGTFTMGGSGSLKTANTSATPIPAGETWGFDIEYSGASQTVVAGTYSGDLTMSGSGVKTPTADITFTHLLTINTGVTLDMGTNALIGALTTAGTGLLKTSNTTTTPLPAGRTWAFVVEYSGAGQTVMGGTYTGGLTMSGSGTKTAAAAIAENGVLTIGTNITLDMGTFALTGTTITTAGTGLLQTANTTANPIPTSKTWAFEVSYNGAAQVIIAGTYNGNLTLAGSGLKTVGGDIADNGVLTVGTGISMLMGGNLLSGVTSTSGTGLLSTSNTTSAPIPANVTWTFEIDYIGTGQTVAAGTYNGELNIAGTSIKTAGGNITVGTGNLTIGSTLDMSSFTLSGTFTPAGTGLLKTANTSSAPVPAGNTWTFEVDYVGAAQTVAAGTYNGELNIAGTLIKTAGGNIAVGTGNLTIGSTLDMSSFALSGAFTPVGTGLLKTANTSSTPIPTGKTWTCSVEYNGAAQTVVTAASYGVNLTMSGSGIKLANGALPVVGTLTIGTGITLDMGANVLSGAFTPAGAGLLQTANTSSTPVPTGKTWTFEVEYNGTAQSVLAGTYNGDLTISGTGTKTALGTVALGAAILKISSTLDMSTMLLTGTTLTTSGAGLLQTANTSAAPVPTGRTWAFNVEYNGASVAVMAGTYNTDLTLSGTATKKASGSITVGRDFTLNLTNNTACHFDLNTAATTFTLTINRDFIGTLGDFNFNTGTAASTMTVKGNFTNTGANIQTSGTTVSGTVIFGGAGTIASPQIFTNTSTANITKVTFQVPSGTVVQANSTWPLERETTTALRGAITVESGGILNMQGFSTFTTDNNATGSGNSVVNINSGGTIMTSNASGLPGTFPATNSIITYSSAANYEFDGTAASVTGTFTTTPTALTVNNLTINSANTVSASQGFSVAGVLALTNGTLNMGTNLLSAVGSNTGTGIIETQNTTTAPIPGGKTWSSAIKYDAATAGQTIVTGTYKGLTTDGSGTKTFAAGTINVGGDWSTTNGKIDLTTNAVTLNFTGASAQAIADAGTDSGNGVFFKTVGFSGGGTKTLSGAGKFSVATNGTLTMSGATTLNAAGLLWLKSDITGTAVVAQIPSGSSITGNVNAERFIYGNNDNARRGYRLMSSTTHDGATSTYNVFSIKQNMYITGNPDAAPSDPNDATKFDNSPNHGATIYHYYEPNTGGQSSADFHAIGLPLTTDEFKVGEGMYVFNRGARTPTDLSGNSRFVTTVKPEDNAVVYKGTLNQGTYTVPLSYTNTSSTSDGYNLVGNPYPSTIDLQGAGITYTNLDDHIYVIDPLTKAFCVINRTSGAVTGNASRYIASGQGFFVQATGAGPSITFNESAKVGQQLTSLATPKLLMSTGPMAAEVKAVSQQLKLKMINPADSAAADDILIVFSPTAKDTYDQAEDSNDFGGNGTVFLSSYSKDNVKLAINVYPAITKDTKIRLAAISNLTASFNMVAGNLASLDPKYDALLIDNYKTDTIKLSVNGTYAFAVDRTIPATYADGRFEIAFSEKRLAVNTLLTFEGNQNKKNIDLDWKIGPELLPVTFTLQKSTDKVNFTTLTTLPSNSQAAYTFTDKDPNNGDNYYRLIQTDAANQLKYSDTIDVKYDKAATTEKPFKLYPLPVVNTLNITLNKDYDGPVKFKIVDVFGLVVKKGNFKGRNFSMDLSKLYIGIYVIDLSNDKQDIGQAIFIKL